MRLARDSDRRSRNLRNRNRMVKATCGRGNAAEKGSRQPQVYRVEKISRIVVNLGKMNFQLHGLREDGSAVFRKKVSRGLFLADVSGRRPQIVAKEAYGCAHYWGRELRLMGSSFTDSADVREITTSVPQPL